ncbi:MAG: hypothetical protein NT062_38580, partial [Proteobacteria bacterium]|nr:hypothetical protein [Pseudomonadota bacterium]
MIGLAACGGGKGSDGTNGSGSGSERRAQGSAGSATELDPTPLDGLDLRLSNGTHGAPAFDRATLA